MNHRATSSKFLSIMMVLTSVFSTSRAQSDPAKLDLNGPVHVSEIPARRVEVRITNTFSMPNRVPRKWAVIAGIPVDGCGQSRVESKLFAVSAGDLMGQTISDKSALGQQLLFVEYPATSSKDRTAVFRAEYKIALSKRRLEAGLASAPIRPLTELERSFFLNSNPFTNFAEPRFQIWLGESGFMQAKSERVPAFAYRVLGQLSKKVKYGIPGPQDACSVVAQGGSTCGGLSNLFTAIMRANGIPARFLPGRWMTRAKSVLQAKGYLVFDPNTMHVKAEFFDEAAGWIPVQAVPSSGSSVDNEFGIDKGDFVTLSFDNYEMPFRGGGSGAFMHFNGTTVGGTWDGWRLNDQLEWNEIQ